MMGSLRSVAGPSLVKFYRVCFNRKTSILFLAVAGVLAGPANGLAQEVERLTPLPVINAALDFRDNRVLDLKSSSDGSFELVALPPDETVAIALAVPASLAGKILIVGALDGGTISVAQDESLTVSDKGLITFSFNAGPNPGTYRVVVQTGDSEDDHWRLSFSVPNPTDAAANPAALQSQPVSTED